MLQAHGSRQVAAAAGRFEWSEELIIPAAIYLLMHPPNRGMREGIDPTLSSLMERHHFQLGGASCTPLLSGICTRKEKGKPETDWYIVPNKKSIYTNKKDKNE